MKVLRLHVHPYCLACVNAGISRVLGGKGGLIFVLLKPNISLWEMVQKGNSLP